MTCVVERLVYSVMIQNSYMILIIRITIFFDRFVTITKYEDIYGLVCTPKISQISHYVFRSLGHITIR